MKKSEKNEKYQVQNPVRLGQSRLDNKFFKLESDWRANFACSPIRLRIGQLWFTRRRQKLESSGEQLESEVCSPISFNFGQGNWRAMKFLKIVKDFPRKKLKKEKWELKGKFKKIDGT